MTPKQAQLSVQHIRAPGASGRDQPSGTGYLTLLQALCRGGHTGHCDTVVLVEFPHSGRLRQEEHKLELGLANILGSIPRTTKTTKNVRPSDGGEALIPL